MLSMTDCLRSRYLTYHGLVDAGLDSDRAATITAIVHGPEPSEDDVIGGPLEWSQPADQQFEPAPEDLAWLDQHPVLPPISGGAPDDEAWDEYAAWSAWQDALEASHPRFGEDDARAAGLAVG